MPFIKTTSDGKKEVQVRSTIAILFTFAIIAGFFLDKVNADQFMGIVTMAISWYFAKANSSDTKKGDGL